MRLAEVCKVLVIGEEGDRVMRALKIVAPLVQGVNYSK